MQDYFAELADWLQAQLRGREVFTANFAGEESDFARFAGGAVRQAGRALQRQLELDWIEGRRHATGSLALAGNPELDRPRLATLVDALRSKRAETPEDPHLLYAEGGPSGELRRRGRLPAPEDLLDAVRDAARGGEAAGELVGVWAAGPIQRGFASSFGQRNWLESESHHLDWSLHGPGGAAVKLSYAGDTWDAGELARRCEHGAVQLRALARPPRALAPGRYRVYLAPDAVRELLELLGWGGFGLRALRTGVSPLRRLAEGEAELAPAVTLREYTAGGIAPNFEAHGFARPDEVPLVREGRHAGCLVSPRSAVEYGVPTNGADAAEAPESIDMAPGRLPRDAVLRELGRGLYVGNLWYLNYSDRPACRITGMTRFATFWVEGGALAAPVPSMRFDETLYRMLGEKLVALTREREMRLDANTYGQRSTQSARVPGALIDDVTLTL